MSRPPSPPGPGVRDLADVPPVGRGFRSDVYPWGDGRVLKLFHPRVGREQIEREFRSTRAVHAAGLPTPAVFETVELGGRCGVVLERIDGPTVLEHVQRRPWAVFDAVRLLAELHARINRCPAPAELPSQRERIAEGIDAAPDLSDADRRAARRRLAALPDGSAVCHGDFHPGNVLLSPRGPVVLDWDTATRGHPHGDVACTVRLLRHAGLPPSAPVHAQLMLRGLRPMLLRTYLRHYLLHQPGTRREIEAWQLPLGAARAWRMSWDAGGDA